MASTTISGLNPVLQAIKSMKVAVDRYDDQGLPVETNNLTLEQILELFEVIGNTPPTGTPLICVTDTIPSGYLELNGGSFDMALYPQLALVFASGVLPDWRGRTPKHAPEGRNAGEFEEDNIKSHGHTATFTGNELEPHEHEQERFGEFRDAAGGSRYNYCAGSTKIKTSKVSAGTPSGLVSVSLTGAAENTVKGVFVRYMVRAR